MMAWVVVGFCAAAACGAAYVVGYLHGVAAAPRLDGILLPGWDCKCGAFNGCAREQRTECRSCGAKRPA